ncbi:MAG: anti-sigma factor family protein [Bryobacteraceae bacterium]
MHAVLLDSLEEYLAGTLTPAARQTFETHLTGCESCREEMDGLKDVSGLFESLRSDETFTPSPAFYSKVMGQVEERRSIPSFSNLFNLDVVFGWRLAYSCLLTIAVLVGFVVTRETRFSSSLSPEAVMAQQNLPVFDSGTGRDNMLITMTSYEQ